MVLAQRLATLMPFFRLDLPLNVEAQLTEFELNKQSPPVLS